MAFNPSAGINRIPNAPVGTTEIGNYNLTLNFFDFEDGLIAGRFCKVMGPDSILSNLDGTATPYNFDGTATSSIVGVALREVINPAEDGDLITKANNPEGAQACIKGIVVVSAKSGVVPRLWDHIYVDNTDVGDYGKATVIPGPQDIAINAVFVADMGSNKWKIAIL